MSIGQSPDIASTFRDAPVLIIGGLGFIGSNLAHDLVTRGARVHLFDCLIPKHGGVMHNIANIAEQVKVTVGDLRDDERLAAAVTDARFVFNLAGQSSHWESMTDPLTDLDINCRAQLRLLESIRRWNPRVTLVFASTRQIYGSPRYLPVDEEHRLEPVDINGIHKVASESYHELYARVYGLRCTTLWLTNTIGPRMRIRDARQTFFGLWIRCAVEGQPFEVWGGDQLRDFNFIDDVVDALLIAAALERAAGRVYNLGSTPVTLRNLAEIFRDVTGCDYVVTPFPHDRKIIDIGNYYASYARIQNELGWQPRTSLRDAVKRTIEYYKEHHDHYV